MKIELLSLASRLLVLIALGISTTVVPSCFCAVHAQIDNQAAAEINPTVSPSASGSDSLERVREQLAEVRRDQLNYRVEKEILEKSYATSIQTISTVVTILFGVFTVLGIFGLKDIASFKKDFSTELDRLREVRGAFEVARQELLTKQEVAENEYKKLLSQNQEQDRKLRVLELREKVAKIINRLLKISPLGLKPSFARARP
jgi:hypothetical protein